MNPTRTGISRLTGVAGLIVVVVVLGAVLLYGFSSTGVSTSTTSTSTSNSGNCTSAVTISSYTQLCAAPMNYTTFQQYVNESSSIQHQSGAIILIVGYNQCTNQFYVLPNATDVEIHLGTANSTQTCG